MEYCDWLRALRNGTADYVQILATDVPVDVVFVVPAGNQGQMIETAYGGFGRGEKDYGDPYKRVVNRSERTTSFYMRIKRGER